MTNQQMRPVMCNEFMLEPSFFFPRDIQPGRIIKSEVICTPTRVGEKKIVARLTSNQVKDISVEKAITVTH